MAYSLIEQQTRDLDLFLKDNEKFIHIASGGGQIPNQLAENDVNNENFLIIINGFQEELEIEINPQLTSILEITEESLESYLSDFVRMARLGFHSYDKTNLGQFENYIFHLVARPKNPSNTVFLIDNTQNIPTVNIVFPSDFKPFNLLSQFKG